MLKCREDLTKLRDKYQKSLSVEKKRILVCAGTGCVSNGALQLFDRFKQYLDENKIPCSVELKEEAQSKDIGIRKTGCQGLCEISPLVRIVPEGWLYARVKPEDCEEIVQKTIIGGEHIGRLAYQLDGKTCKVPGDIPFYQHQVHMVLEQVGHISATSINEYLATGGYSAFEKALFDISADEIVDEVSKSGLRGRGGGGFATGVKWTQVKRQKRTPKYIVCNGDEGDPGAFMDCSIMEGNPHSVLEGMMIAGVACGGSDAYIYVRAEYPRAVERLRIAIAQATEYGLLGNNILGTDFCFNVKINRGAGAFVCGEGSAMTASIEGRRGMPRTKPPRTVEYGLFNQPTVLNNVETFANIPSIIKNGADWLKKVGTEKSPGTKAFSLTGNIRNTGLIEVPMGTTLRQVIFDIGGGLPDGGEFKAVQIGGPSGACLTAKHLDLPLDFDSLKKVGAMVGSGGLVVMDNNTCMIEVARFFMNFTQKESCGKCVPCREGTKRMLEIIERIVSGAGEEGDVELLLELSETITETSLCGLGKSAAFPVLSTIKNFPEEYDVHIKEKRCPTGTCQQLKQFVVDAVLCKGCTKCLKCCPVDAISGKVKEPFVIDNVKCIKCAACVDVCPFKAIKEVF